MPGFGSQETRVWYFVNVSGSQFFLSVYKEVELEQFISAV